ncbi:superinfection immunity protein [Streptomyces sp. OR43]|uniref:superinfection immunity protein n=1 Tax=Streptomyces sp. or43 TaxID=2478957 RepID=UPI001C9D05A4|nr:superinfection immunity protein [Streptomyces sp. or43]
MTGLLSLVDLGISPLPSLTACDRGTGKRWLVPVVNVVLGATFLDWAVALVPAPRKPKVPSAA